MARVKGRVPLTFSLAPELVNLADVHAGVTGLDRYDVLRLAIAKGLLVLRMEHEMEVDQDGKYMRLMLKLAAGDGEVSDVESDTVGDAMIEGVKRDQAKKRKRGRRVEDAPVPDA